ncbi:HEAT repeat domain-containing protein [uncultured Desulfovibrio sp.]|uniref:HEAT repeat domain-containing protein n=1 Tax=uncultured Desulfovibrio sp. TaxID=167968 RepID=UPI0026040BC8|nr:HEAT repeat domain-containing protein [uncultured Desulfovibrio sp.]
MSENPQQILDALSSDDSSDIRDAAFSAGDLGLQDAVPLLCEHVKSPNVGVQEAAEYALRKIRGPQVVDALLPLLSSDDAPVRNVAMDILREIGTDSIESMQPYMQHEDADLRIFVTDILGYCRTPQACQMLCRALLKDPEINVRYQAAVSLGTQAFPEAVSALCQAMYDEEWVQFAVVEALAKIKDYSAVSAMVKLLSQASPLVSSAIVDALGDLGDVKSIPLLFSSLENVKEALRHKIVRAIVQILGGRGLSLLAAKSKDRLRDYLLEALTDTDEDVLTATLQGLSAIGGESCGKPVMDMAAGIDRERDAELYEEVVRTIAAIGYTGALHDALHSGDEKCIIPALEACRLMDDGRIVNDLKEIFWQLSPELQRMAINEMARLGGCADVPFFVTVMNDADDAELLKCALAFFGNQNSCADVDDLVFAQLDHRYVDVKEMALEACINLHSANLNKRFKERARSEDPMQRMMAVYALGRYSVTENLEEISAALDDESPRTRQVAVDAFQNLGPQAEEYLPRLLPRLNDENKDVRLAVVELLGQMDSPAVLPHILEALHDENEWVRIRAVEALGTHKVTDAVPQLAELFEGASPMVAQKIIEALGNIGGNVAFSVLLGMMDHEDPDIQHAAADAVAAIQAEQE